MSERKGSKYSKEDQIDEAAMAREMLFNFTLDLYFDPKSWERNGRVYELLGIKLFKRFQPNGGDNQVREKFKGTQKRPFLSKSYSTLFALERETRKTEAVHICMLIAFEPLVEAAFQASPALGAIFTAANIAINVYPIMLQRYNRTRLYGAMERSHRLHPNQ